MPVVIAYRRARAHLHLRLANHLKANWLRARATSRLCRELASCREVGTLPHFCQSCHATELCGMVERLGSNCLDPIGQG